MPVDLTSPWIPLSLIMLLGIFMIRQFMQERREAREMVLAEASAPAVALAPAGGSPEQVAAPSAPPAKSEEAPKKKKRKLRWRTAWIWMPFLIGFLGQAYLSFVKPMMDGAGQ